MLRRNRLRGRSVPIPSVGTVREQTQPIDYAKGWHTGNPNDLQPKRTLRNVFDMRFSGLGKYITRKGCDRYSVPIGEAVNVEVTSTAGAADGAVTTTTVLAEKVTATATGVATRIDIRIKNSAAATGAALIKIYADDSGSPGALLATTTIANADITTSYAYETCYSIEAPTITNTEDYWVSVQLQDSGTGTMYVSTTTNSTNAKQSTDGGQTWASTAYSLNVKLYTSTSGGVRGVTRAYRPDGTAATFFAHGTSLYKIDDLDGSTTSIDTIGSGTTNVRFDYVNDTLFYVDGVGKPRKYNWSGASEVTASPYNTTNIMEHVGLLFYFDKADPTRMFYTNFADYEVFTSTDFIYVPAPKRSDHLTAMAKLNGVLYPFTRSNKYQLLGQDNATFRLDEAYAQKGTFSQESVVYDENFVYFASDDGVYRFNGTYEENIAEAFIGDYTSILAKSTIHLQLHDNKLYIWYTPNGQAEQKECFVYNTLYKVPESVDLNTYIGKSFARLDTTDMFLQASNRAGVIYYSEQSANNYHNLGSQMFAETRTAYDHFGSPNQYKRITYWRPVLDSVAGDYGVQAGFATDYSDDVNYSTVNLQGQGFTYDDAASLYDAITYQSSAAIIDTTLQTYGSAVRWQRRYKHQAAYEPIQFAGEVLKIQTRRLR